MAQIIQYKDRERDASVYPITVGAAVYMSDGTTENVTLDNIIARKVDSISIVDDPTLQNTGDYPYVPTTVGSNDTALLDDNLQKNARINIGVDGIITGVEKQVGDIKQQVENKQDRLETGVNIKFINGFNILGPGTLDVYKTDTVIGIDSSLIVDSSNAIMNSTVTQKFNSVSTDMSTLRSDISNDMSTLRNDVSADMSTLRSDISNDMSTLRNDVSTDMSTLRSDVSILRNDIPLILGGNSIVVKNSSSTASGNFTTALGVGTTATQEGESSFGKYNISKANTLFSIGNGTENNKMNLVEAKTTNDVFLYSKIKGGYVKLDDIIGRLDLNVYDINDSLLSDDIYDISSLEDYEMPLTTYFDRMQNFLTVRFVDLGDRHFYIPTLPSTSTTDYNISTSSIFTVKVKNDNITLSRTTGSYIIDGLLYGMTPEPYYIIANEAITTSLYYNFSNVLETSRLFYLYSGNVSKNNNFDFRCVLLSSMSDKSITEITNNDKGYINVHRYGDNFSIQSLSAIGDYYPFMCTTNIENANGTLSFDMIGTRVGPVVLKVTNNSGVKTIYLPICKHDDDSMIVVRLKESTYINSPFTIESRNSTFNSLDKISYMNLTVKDKVTPNVYSTNNNIIRTEVCPFKCYSTLTAHYYNSASGSNIRVNIGSSYISFGYSDFAGWAREIGLASGYNCPVYFVHGGNILFVAVADNRTGVTYLYNCDPDAGVQFS